MSQSHKTYTIGSMDCANCAKEVETGVGKLDGVQGVRVNFAAGKMTVDGDVAFEVLQRRVEALGKTIVDGETVAAPAKTRHTGIVGFWHYLRGRGETRLALIGGGIILLGLLLSLTPIGETPPIVIDGLLIMAMLVALYPIAKSGLNTLRINREFNINLLMSIAAVGAVVIGEYLEAATVIFLFAVAEALEGYTADRARDSLRSLMELTPNEAIRLHDGREDVVPVEQLRIGDHIIIKPGERVAMDGEVVAGQGGVNQAPITGESIPVHKSPGGEVFAGSINGEGALQVRVTKLAADNTLSRIIEMVEEAQSVRAPSQRLVDRFAHYYTPAVVAAAVLVALIPPLFLGASFYDTPDARGWFYRALSMLVIACPCALVISTPVTVISAITLAARRGVLIKGGAYLEALGGVRAFAFDKTGTLTRGEPVVTLTRAIDCESDTGWCACCEDVLALAAAVESRSAHPLAQAVVGAATERGVEHNYAPAERVEVLAGRGVQGYVPSDRGEKLVTVGSHSLFEAEHPHSPEFCQLIDEAESQGQTTMLLCDGDGVRGFIAVADEAREDSKQVICDLKALGIHTTMLTGDNRAVAESVGQQVGVDGVRAELLPEDKVEAVRALLDEFGAVAMVGDGVNDTPALAAATVGVAMGGAGSAQAMETADIALMADDLKQLPFAVRLSRFARRLIVQNIALSFGMKLGFMALAVAGGATLWMAVFADMGMSLMVTLNGMRAGREG